MLTLLMDMDGPLAGFDARFFAMCDENQWPCDFTRFHRFATDHLSDEHARLARIEVNKSGWFRSLPPTPGAQEGLTKLEKYADVWVCTKPLEANPTCRDEKAAWLVEHFGKRWEKKLIVTPDKSMIRGDILLDDAPRPEWYARASWTPVIFTMPWNGEGSQWGDRPHWTWGDPYSELFRDLWAIADAGPLKRPS